MKKLIAIFLVLALTLSLTACGTPVPSETTAAPVETTVPAGPSEIPVITQPTAGDGITLIDQAGREVKLEAPAQTIVSCYYITSYACVALGLADRVIGLEKGAPSRPIYQMAAPELLEKSSVGSLKEFNVEAAAALEPELVILPKKLMDHADVLTQLGIPVLVVDPETQEGLELMLQLIAVACGVEENAEKLLAYYAEQLTRIGDRIPGGTLPRVYLGSNSAFLETAPDTMYQSHLIRMAGGENVAAELEGDYWTEISYETLLAMNPEVIVIPCAASYSREDVLQDPQLAGVTAVKNGAVYQMPKGIEEWDSPVPSGILGVMWLTSILYPDTYSFEAFQADVVSFYETFYGFTIDTALITK